MPDERVSLLYTSDVRPEVPTLAPVLCGVLGVTMVDARRMARYGRGIFLEKMERARVDALLPVLKNMGLECVCVPTSSILRPPPKPVRCVLADPAGDTFRYKVSFQRDYEHVPWEAIKFVSVGIVATQQFRDAMATSIAGSLPVIYRVDDPEAKAELREAIARKASRRTDEISHDGPPGMKHDAVEGSGGKELTDLQRKTRERILKDELDTLYREQTDTHLDLFIIGMSGRYRISRRDFRFDYLGPRAKSTSLENFKTLVEDVLVRLPDALVPPMTERYRTMTDVREVFFDTLDEFERYNVWAFHMAGMGYPVAARPIVEAKIAPEEPEAGGGAPRPAVPAPPPAEETPNP